MSAPDSKGWHVRESDPEGVQRWYDGRQWTTKITGGKAYAELERARRERDATPFPPQGLVQHVRSLEEEVARIAEADGLGRRLRLPGGGAVSGSATGSQLSWSSAEPASNRVPAQPPALTIASMGARLGARVIDGVITLVAFWLLNTIVGAVFGSGDFATFLDFLILLAALWGYQAYFVGATGQTPGKRVAGIRVVDARGSNFVPIGFGRAFGREVVLGLTGSLCLIGYLSPFFDRTRRHRGWHDKAVDDFVVVAR